LRENLKLTVDIFELLRDLLHQVGDYVLAKTLVPREEEDDKISDGVQCYVPGIVQVVPLRKAPATKCYTILRYNGKKVSRNLNVHYDPDQDQRSKNTQVSKASDESTLDKGSWAPPLWTRICRFL